jgi:hypothetical protein
MHGVPMPTDTLVSAKSCEAAKHVVAQIEGELRLSLQAQHEIQKKIRMVKSAIQWLNSRRDLHDGASSSIHQLSLQAGLEGQHKWIRSTQRM